MSGADLLVDEIDGRLHAAIVYKGVLHDLYTDSHNTVGLWSSIYMGKVVKIDTALDSAIVDLGGGLQGILAAKHVIYPGEDTSQGTGKKPSIAQMVSPGQKILVQIKSEARRGTENERHKLPRLTMKIVIIGQYLMHCPVSDKIILSKKNETDKTRKMAEELKGHGGWIIQAAADKADYMDVKLEANAMFREWKIIRDSIDDGRDSPQLGKNGLNALRRSLCDYGDLAFDHIYAGNKKILDVFLLWSKKHDPSLADSKRLRLFKPEKPGQRLFDIHDIYGCLEDLKEKTVYLNGGGSIVIEEAHAFTVIDVNQGEARNIIEVNRQAAFEIGRQIRLRNLSGAILVDFINMKNKSDRFELIETLETIFQQDKIAVQVHGFTRLGIAEITRKRRSASYAEKFFSATVSLKK